MDIDRRRLMTGTLAGAAFLSMNGLSWTLAAAPQSHPAPALLLSTQLAAGEALLRGAQAGMTGYADSALPLVSLSEAFPGATPAANRLLASLQGRDCLAVLPTAAAMLFLQVARDAGMRLLWMGTHTGSARAGWQRHELTVYSPVTAPTEALCSQLGALDGDSVIREQRLYPFANAPQGAPRPMTGMDLYQGADSQLLYCTGLSPNQAGHLAGLQQVETWTQVASAPAPADSGPAWKAADWQEALGFALIAAALDTAGAELAGPARAMVQRSGAGQWHQQPDQALMSLALAA